MLPQELKTFANEPQQQNQKQCTRPHGKPSTSRHERVGEREAIPNYKNNKTFILVAS